MSRSTPQPWPVSPLCRTGTARSHAPSAGPSHIVYEGAVPSRRSCLRWALTAIGALGSTTTMPLAALLVPQSAHAGGQVEEPLADSVRIALHAAVDDMQLPEPVFVNTAALMRYLRWLTAASDRLRRFMPDLDARRDFLQTVWYEATRARLEVDLVLGLIQVESGFRQHIVSPAGARGYMQIMPFWARLIGDGDADKLFHTQINLRFGCVILRHYLEREHNDLFMALGRYNGSAGQAKYPQAVLAARKKWQFDVEEKSAPEANTRLQPSLLDKPLNRSKGRPSPQGTPSVQHPPPLGHENPAAHTQYSAQ